MKTEAGGAAGAGAAGGGDAAAGAGAAGLAHQAAMGRDSMQQGATMQTQTGVTGMKQERARPAGPAATGTGAAGDVAGVVRVLMTEAMGMSRCAVCSWLVLPVLSVEA